MGCQVDIDDRPTDVEHMLDSLDWFKGASTGNSYS